MAKKAARKGATKTTGATKTARAATRKTAKRAAGAKKTTARRKTARGAKKSGGTRKAAAKRETIDTGSDKRYVRRSRGGRFKESDDVSQSLSADARKKAKTRVKKGQGDRGDR
jgi:hypothetical protein